MKKNLFIIVAIIILGVLSGCSNQKGTEADSEKAATITSGESSLTEELSNAAVGDSIFFGNYEQDGDLQNGPEEIEWRVLDEQDGNLLLVSVKVLDEVPYFNDSEKDTWADSYARSWLNDDFLNAAFSEAEQDHIRDTTVCTLREVEWDSVNGDDTQDKVFILSSTEFCDYLPDYLDRQAGVTKYGNKSKHTGTEWVWLRSNGIDSDVRCMKDGNVFYEGEAIAEDGDTDYIGVRPAIWVNISSDTSKEIIMGENEQARLTQVGDIISFGDLDWQVLAIEEDRLFLVTKNCLYGKMAYNSNSDDASWEASTVRSWLNNEFLEEYFSKEEIEKIMTTTVVTDNSNDTDDKVFLLSKDEAELYFYTNDERTANDPGGVNTVEWLLRSAEKEEFRVAEAMYVNKGGTINLYPVGRACAYIRPALWVQDQTMLLHEIDGDTDTDSLLEILTGNNPVRKDSDGQADDSSEKYSYLMSDIYIGDDQHLTATATILGSKYYRKHMQSITFLDGFDEMPNTAWDVSEARDRSVMAWVVYDENTEYYDLYIASEDIIVANNCRDLFAGYCDVTSINFNGRFRIGETDKMYRMFYGDLALQELDVSFFDTSEVLNMHETFMYCNKLTELDVSGWDTGNVRDFSGMFQYCISLQSLNLSGWDTGNATDMSNMFWHCTELNSLGVDSVYFSDETNTDAMFVGTKWE